VGELVDPHPFDAGMALGRQSGNRRNQSQKKSRTNEVANDRFRSHTPKRLLCKPKLERLSFPMGPATAFRWKHGKKQSVLPLR
jgi:hypothetical protein